MDYHTPDYLIKVLKERNLLKKGYKTRKAIIRETLDRAGIGAYDESAGEGYILQAKTTERWFINGTIAQKKDRDRAVGLLGEECAEIKADFINMLVPGAKLDANIQQLLFGAYREQGYNTEINLSVTEGADVIYYCFILSLFGHTHYSLSELLSRKDRPELPARLQPTGFETGKETEPEVLRSLLPSVKVKDKAISFDDILKESSGVSVLKGGNDPGKSFALKMLYNIVCEKYNGGETAYPVFISCGDLVRAGSGLNSILPSYFEGRSADGFLGQFRHLRLYIFIDDIARLDKRLQNALVREALGICSAADGRIRFFITDAPVPYRSGGITEYTLTRKNDFCGTAGAYLKAAGTELPKYMAVIDSVTMLRLHIEMQAGQYRHFNMPCFPDADSRGKFLANFILIRKAGIFERLLSEGRREIECSVIAELIFDVLLPGMAYIGQRNRRRPVSAREEELIALLKVHISANDPGMISGLTCGELVSYSLGYAADTGLVLPVSAGRNVVYIFTDAVYDTIFTERYFALKIAGVISFINAEPFCQSGKQYPPERVYTGDPVKDFTERYRDLYGLYFLPESIIKYSEDLEPFIAGCIREERISSRGTSYPDISGPWLEKLLRAAKDSYTRPDDPGSRQIFYILAAAVCSLSRNTWIGYRLSGIYRDSGNDVVLEVRDTDIYPPSHEAVYSRCALMLNYKYDTEEKLPPDMFEALMLIVCADDRKYLPFSQRSPERSFSLLHAFNADRSDVYRYGRTHQPYPSFTEQLARTMAAVCETEKERLTGKPYGRTMHLDTDDIRYSGIGLTDDQGNGINDHAPDETTLRLRLEIMKQIALKMLRLNAETNLSASSAASLAVYERHSGNMAEALRLLGIALTGSCGNTEDREYLLRERAAAAAEMYARHIREEEAERALGLRQGGLADFLEEQYGLLDECPQKQLVRLSLDAASDRDLSRIYGGGDALPLPGKVILLEKYLETSGSGDRSKVKDRIGALTGNIYREIADTADITVKNSYPLFEGISMYELRRYAARTEETLSAAGLAGYVKKTDFLKETIVEQY